MDKIEGEVIGKLSRLKRRRKKERKKKEERRKKERRREKRVEELLNINKIIIQQHITHLKQLTDTN